jgi:hypothetical protein
MKSGGRVSTAPPNRADPTEWVVDKAGENVDLRRLSMKKQKVLVLAIALLLGLATVAAVQPAFADTLSEAIAQVPRGTE